MKRLSMLFSLLALVFVSSSAFAQFTQMELVKEFQRAKNYTKVYLDAMPEDGYGFKPTPEIRSFAQQMGHLADANYFFASTASGTPSPFGKKSVEQSVPGTKAEMTKAVMDSYDYVISSLQALPVDKLNETVSLENQKLTRFQAYGKAFEHQTHHRGQCTFYLRLKGVVPPGEMLF